MIFVVLYLKYRKVMKLNVIIYNLFNFLLISFYMVFFLLDMIEKKYIFENDFCILECLKIR